MSSHSKQQHSKLAVFCFRLFELLAVLSFAKVVWELKAPKEVQELVRSLDGSLSLAFLAGAVAGVAATLTVLVWSLWKFINRGKP